MKLREHSPWWRRVARTFGRELCRLAENNVRFIQVTYGDNGANPAWDQHSNMPKHGDHLPGWKWCRIEVVELEPRTPGRNLDDRDPLV